MDTVSQIVSGVLDCLTANTPPFSLPNVPSHNPISICHAAASISETEALVVHVESEFVIVGDLHGHVLDLLPAFIQFSLSPATKYIFLSHYVDRGEFSIHAILCLLALKCRCPRSV
jgi:hypothetical protein